MDEIYDAIDSFNAASKLAFEHEDTELEARCEAWIGKIYDKGLKKEAKAMAHYNNVIRLANSLQRSLANLPWFEEARKAHETI